MNLTLVIFCNILLIFQFTSLYYFIRYIKIVVDASHWNTVLYMVCVLNAFAFMLGLLIGGN